MATETHLLYKIAKAYYEDGLTQDQIGRRFGLSRIKVSRLLQQARQARVVQITITPPSGSSADLERAVETAFGLDEVVVVATAGEAQAAVAPLLGQAAAAYLARCIGDGEVLALSWGTTLLAAVDAITPQNLPGVRVVQMLGGLGSAESEVYGGDLAVRLAHALGAKMRLIPAPGIVASRLVRDALLQDVTIAETLALAQRADIALVGIGSPMPGSVVVQAGILTEQDLADLQAAGAVGDVALRFFDGAGRPVDHPINDHIIGLDLEQIRRIPRVIGVAGGADKYEVVRGAACGHLIDVLITDELTALRLMAGEPGAGQHPGCRDSAPAAAAA